MFLPPDIIKVKKKRHTTPSFLNHITVLVLSKSIPSAPSGVKLFTLLLHFKRKTEAETSVHAHTLICTDALVTSHSSHRNTASGTSFYYLPKNNGRIKVVKGNCCKSNINNSD